MATIVFIVALIAVDAALVRYLFLHTRSLMVSVRFGFLMVNLLALASHRLWVRRGENRPFLLGFVAFGLVTALLCQAGCILAPDAMYALQQGPSYRVASFLNTELHAYFPSLQAGSSSFRFLFYATTIPAIGAVVGFPQLVVALAGGLSAWWMRRLWSPNIAIQRPRLRRVADLRQQAAAWRHRWRRTD
jgi:hypothetical protein